MDKTAKEKFIEKVKQLTVDYWTMGLHNGTFESHFRDLLEEYEERDVGLSPLPLKCTCWGGNVDCFSGNCSICGNRKDNGV